MEDVRRPPAYEARVFVGADTTLGRVIARWLDSARGPDAPHEED